MKQSFWSPLKVIALYVILCAHLAVATYWLIVGGICISKIIVGIYAPRMDLWWMVLFYSSEVGGIIGVVFRWTASVLALCASIILFKYKAAVVRATKIVSAALIMEGVYFISLIPTVILGWVYYFTAGHFYYFDHTPREVVLLINGVGCLPMATVTPLALLKLSSVIRKGKPYQEIVKWSCFTSLAYLFTVFWFNYLNVWFATLFPWPARGQPGLSFLFDPINCTSFIATSIGLLFINIFTVISFAPAIKKTSLPTARRVGWLMLVFGGYYLLVILLYVISGGYATHPTAWHEIIGPAHNPDLWCISFLVAGILILIEDLILYRRPSEFISKLG